jgi:acylglycerol lipase
VHGYSDHCNAYYNLFPSLATRGIAVHTFDQRGWGRSAPERSQRGDSGPTDTVLADIRSFLNYIVSRSSSNDDQARPNSVPLFLMGHSMGGAEVLLLSLLQSQPQSLPRISGILLESPFIAFHPSAQPSSFTVMAGKLASKVVPRRQLLQKLESKHLCRDQQVCRDWEKDDLCHDTGTLEGLTGMLQRAADLTTLANGRSVHGMGLKNGLGVDQPGPETVPIWIGHGTEDRVTNCSSSKAMFEKLDVKDKTIKLYEGAYHKLHAEPDGVAEEFADDVANWILERAADGRQEGEAANDMRPKL